MLAVTIARGVVVDRSQLAEQDSGRYSARVKAQQPAPLGEAIARAVASIRGQLGDPTAIVAVIVPSDVSGVLVRQQLALAGPFIGVEFGTPERLVRELARPRMPEGWGAEPAAWLRSVLGVLLEQLAEADQLGRHGPALRQPGWRRPVARALERLEGAGLGPDQLEGLAALADTPGPDADRARLLATVLRAVRDRRVHDRLLALGDVCGLARQALEIGGRGPGHRVAGAVVLGDKILSPDVFGVLRAWLGSRAHRVVNPPPLAQLAPAPQGLRAAASGPTVALEIDSSHALGRVQAGLYMSEATDAAAPPAIEPDASLALVATPDEVRDVGEAVREVLRGIAAGIALDRIAVVLPDANQADVLREALASAGVPATWLTGPALLRAPESRGFLLAVELADGDDTVRRWYALLSHPSLDLRRGLGADQVHGRGRWRRILAQCGAVRGTRAIVAAIHRWAAAQTESADDRAAAASLIAAIEALAGCFDAWRTPASLGGFAQRFVEFLHGWWRPSARRARIATTLADWGSATVGFEITLAEASAELRETLSEAADLDGRLGDPRIRVLSPMLCLGGGFDLICATGLTQKRIPSEIREDPLLPDTLLAALAAAHGVTLLTSRVLREFEDRRFAAIVGACTGRLWLASPELELLTERRLLPSRHLLAVASVLAGQRVGYAELRARTSRSGSRARPFPDDPEHAIGELEFRVAAARKAPPQALADLAVRQDTRRLLGLHRALDDARPSPWTGLVSPALLRVPGFAGHEQAILARHLRTLLQDPGAFLFRELLGAWPARALPERWEPGSPSSLGDSTRAAIVAAAEAGDASFASMIAAWQAAVDAQAAVNPHVERVDLAMARTLAENALASFETRAGALVIAVSELVGAPFEGLPWRVDASGTWLGAEGVTALERALPKPKELPFVIAELVVAGGLARAHAVLAETITVYDGSGKSRAIELAPAMAEIHARATRATALLERGWLPWTSSKPFGARLAKEPSANPWDTEERETP
jgi:hypothetical protein